jgi:hypothetical protein
MHLGNQNGFAHKINILMKPIVKKNRLKNSFLSRPLTY